MEKLNYRCCFCNKLIKDVVIKLSTSMHGREKVLQEFFCHGACFHQKIHENYFLNLHEEMVPLIEKYRDISIEEGLWKPFINRLDSIDDPLIVSIFKQARFMLFDPHTWIVHIEFSKDFKIFKDMILKAKDQWLPLLKEVFTKSAHLNIIYQDDE